MYGARRTALLLLSAPALGGCCSIAGWFCGPDRSEWVPISFDSPAATIATFREALRRDDLDVIYRCLGEGYKQRHSLTQVSLTILWERLRAEVPAIHLLGDADVEGWTQLAPDRWRCELHYGSVRIETELVRQPLLEVRVAVPGGDEPVGPGYVDWTPLLRIGPDESIELRIRDHLGLPLGTRPQDVTSIRAQQHWKLDELREAPPD
jgi:hypothetical protein